MPANVLRFLCIDRLNLAVSFFLRRQPLRPYMRKKEIFVIRELLRGKKPMRCLEWGAGHSTLYFPHYLPAQATWYCIEHEQKWYDTIRKRVNRRTKATIQLHHAPINELSEDMLAAEKHKSPYEEYAQYPKSLKTQFDFVLVDGRARTSCLVVALSILAQGAIVVLHDANRKRYHSAFRLLTPHIILLDKRQRDGGLWIACNRCNLTEILNIERFQEVWQQFNRLENFKQKVREVFLSAR